MVQATTTNATIPPITRPVVFQKPEVGFPDLMESTEALGRVMRQESQSGDCTNGTPLIESPTNRTA